MSLYISEWLDGPNEFIDFGNFAWKPQVHCKFKSDNPRAVSTFVTLFELESLKALLEVLSPEIGRKLVKRLAFASVEIIEKLEIKHFLEVNLTPIYNASGQDINKTSIVLSELLDRFILDFEFWNKINIIDVCANLIFYGTFYDPKPFVFITPPMSEWDDSGW